jgi:hypothetical protein
MSDPAYVEVISPTEMPKGVVLLIFCKIPKFWKNFPSFDDKMAIRNGKTSIALCGSPKHDFIFIWVQTPKESSIERLFTAFG